MNEHNKKLNLTQDLAVKNSLKFYFIFLTATQHNTTQHRCIFAGCSTHN